LIWASRLLSVALVASAIVLRKNDAGSAAPYLIAYTAEGISEDVEAELAQVRAALAKIGAAEPSQVAAPSGTELWCELIARAQPDAMQVRVGIAPKDVAAFVRDHAARFNAGSFLTDVASGIITIVAEMDEPNRAQRWLEELRRVALGIGGYAIVTALPEELSGVVERWGYQPESRDLMRALQARWDPAGILGEVCSIRTQPI
jgi:hypothetical protein